MILTKPLSIFLNANRSPQIHTLLLTTPAGKLISSSSSISASTLRGYATVACSLWSMYRPITEAGTITAALLSRSDDEGDDDDDDQARRNPDPDVSSILIQLETGTMVIRALRCSLLLVVIGPSPITSSTSRGLSQGLSYLSLESAASPPTSSHSQHNGESAERRQDPSSSNVNGLGSAATSATGSSMGSTGGSIKIIRRQAEELSKWLDGELEGLSLSSGL